MSTNLETGNTENHWLSISDMMSGLMIIFLFIAISYMINIKKQKDDIEQIAVTYNETQADLYTELYNEFKEDLQKWDAEIDRKTLSVKFKSPDVLFRQGDSHIKQKFKQILNEFFPRFIGILIQDKYMNEIDEIRIEGHTSSEWHYNVNGDIAYIKNMELSQDRTREVLKYVLNQKNKTIKINKEWIKHNLTANGLSSSKLEYKEDGKEDKRLSRRVEFRIKTKAEEKIFAILKKKK